MAKIKHKTHQVIAKRMKKTKTGKILVRRGGQDHFNARETGKTKRNKRRDKQLTKAVKRNINRLV